MKNKCLFCDKDFSIVKNSKEHILRKKNRELFGLNNTNTHFIRRTGDARSTKLEERIYPLSPYEQTVSGICNVCNNGWMNDIDNNFEKLQCRLVKRLPVFAGDNEINKIKLWAYKTALVRMIMDKNCDVGIPHNHLKNLYKSKEPDDDVGIWLFNSHHPMDTHTRHTWGKIEGDEYHQVTISIGAMGVYIIMHNAKAYPQLINDINLELIKTTRGNAIKIWPQGKSFVWPVSMERLSNHAASEVSVTMERILHSFDPLTVIMSLASYHNEK
ncbi:hypothetical protein ACK3ZP_18840 [Aeromonas caviae]